MIKGLWRWLFAAAIISAGVIGAGSFAVAGGGSRGGDGDTPSLAGGAQPLEESEEAQDILQQLDLAFTSRRTAGDTPLDFSQAGELRGEAAHAAKKLRKEHIPSGPKTFDAAWRQIGPNPIVQGTRTSGSFDGDERPHRRSRDPAEQRHQFILGAAQGGIWLYNSATGTWSAKTSDQTTQAIGALAVAPSNDAIVYAGTGEGAFSGDSYFGDGVLKSTDGGNTWAHVSEDKDFRGVSMSRIIVDPNDANHVYAAVLRGRGGARRTSPTEHSKFGIWESKDGGVKWKLHPGSEGLTRRDRSRDGSAEPEDPLLVVLGRRDLQVDRRRQELVEGDGAACRSPTTRRRRRASRSRSRIRAGRRRRALRGLRLGRRRPAITRRASSSRPNGAASWTLLPGGTGADTVEDYCGDAVLLRQRDRARSEATRTSCYAAGQFNYGIGSGGIFRSDDGGETWKNLGYDQHPDFHALAFDPSNPAQVLIGNDGGVWTSPNRGGRAGTGTPLSAVDWVNLNGTVDPGTRRDHRAHATCSIAQFTSIATVPQIPPTTPGSGASGAARRTTARCARPAAAGRVVRRRERRRRPGARRPDARAHAALAPACHRLRHVLRHLAVPVHRRRATSSPTRTSATGLDLTDRSDFYIPFVLNQDNPNQLFLGTYRLYRTDNAKTAIGGRRAVEDDQRRPDHRLRRARTERRAELHDLRDRRRRRRGRVHRLARRPALGQPGRSDQRQPDLDQGRQGQGPAGPAGLADRGRPEQLPDRVRGLQRLQRRDQEDAGSRLPHAGRRQEVD